MKRIPALLLVMFGVAGSALPQAAGPATQPDATTPTTADVLKVLDQLVQQNHELERQNQQLIEQISVLRKKLAADQTPAIAEEKKTVTDSDNASDKESTSQLPGNDLQKKETWGIYTENLGFKVAQTEHGDMNISLYTYVRYLNQLNLKPTYTDAFGNTRIVQQRQDAQLNKVQIKFLGWVMSPKFRYFLYAWTSNATGVGAQTVLAGNVNYDFNKHFTLSGGITSLPGTRSVEGNFPFWLSVDSRLITDEFFRPSYTTGIFARGQLNDHLRYQVMIGNNLSQLGVAAVQIDHHFNTFSSALVWTTNDFGIAYGDFDYHEKLAMRMGAHFTSSTEDLQSQPSTQSLENTQLRLSDGSVIFTPNLFGPGIQITQADYKMTNVDAGIKYRGFSLDGGYYVRWLNHFKGPGTPGLPALFDHGFESQISMMAMPRRLQVYGGGSTIFGQYGTPYDARIGVNFFPWKNKVIRWNGEALYTNKSPVGYTSVPFALGGTGWIFHSSFEMAF